MAGYPARNPKTEAALRSSITKIVKGDSQKKAQPSSKASIYRVPQNLRKLKESAYTPRIVSIGPYHKHDERLKDMEDQKKSYTSSLLSRAIEPGQTTDAAIKEITNMILDNAADARSCYAATHELEDDISFAEMLLVDGCFILELLYRWEKKDHPKNGDPILGNTLVFVEVRHDLLLLENQIPMFVLQALFDFGLVQTSTLRNLIINFFGNMLNSELQIREHVKTETTAHILGFLHDCCLPRDTAASEQKNTNQIIKHSAIDLERAGDCCLPRDTAASEKKNSNQIIKHSAIDLDRAGVYFKVGTRGDQIFLNFSTSFSFLGGTSRGGTSDNNPKRCIYDRTKSRSCCYSWFFQFCGKTNFEIPKLCIYDSTESFLRNLIAFEQCSPSIRHYITSYAFLMDTLINTKEDVEVLEKAGVLENHLGASEDATRLFNTICKEVVLGEFTFLKQWHDVEAYCNSKWPSHVASLRRDYFSSPWVLISVIAGLILFVLTVVQTVYTVRAG
ncbi:hypothetical protein RJ639_008452 [Escallonia herrerae]|uniref:Uncharacterized protein n=1 Tax=Escallonia herrerae TaxID=1293975 RepID=A0AA89ATT1_9ASTE|nr:hypothetical protein RJ639_008452 [Escallonia herrerae]